MTNKRRVDIYIDREVWKRFTKTVKGFSPSRAVEVILQRLMGEEDPPVQQLINRAKQLKLVIQKKKRTKSSKESRF